MLAIFFYVSCWFCRLNFSVCHLLRFLLLLSKSYYFLCVPALIWVITNSLFYPQRARLGQASSKSLAGYAQAFPCWHCTCVAHSRDKQHWQNLGMPPEALVFQTGVRQQHPGTQQFTWTRLNTVLWPRDPHIKSEMEVCRSHKVDVCVRCVVTFFSLRYQLLFWCKIRENEPCTFFEIFSWNHRLYGFLCCKITCTQF